MLEFWGKAEYPFIAIAPRSTLADNGSTWESPIYGLDKTTLCTYVKLNCLKYNSFNIKTAYLCKTELFEIELLIFIKSIWH